MFMLTRSSLEGGKGITKSGGIKASSPLSMNGKGIYAGTTPTPSWGLKHIPLIGWGLGNTPVRIPISLKTVTSYKICKFPMKSMVINTDFLYFG